MKTLLTILLISLNALVYWQDKIYWTDRGDFTISRSNLDGSEIELIHEPQVGQVEDIAFDLANGKMYWAEWVRIRRSDINGENLETLVTGLTRADGIDLDLENGKTYWTERGTHKIQRSNLDGSNTEDLIDSPVPESIALDIENSKMYWTDWQGGNEKIYKANLDGSDKEVLVETSLLGRPFGIELDLMGQKMYWSDSNNGTVNRSDLDGSNIETLLTNLNRPDDISLDLENGKIYILQSQNEEEKIIRSNLDGLEIEEIITSGLSFPTGIALLLGLDTATNEEIEFSMKIQPNPNYGNFTVVSDKIIRRISVYGIDGKFLFEKDVNSSTSDVEMYNYPKGIYTLKIDFDNQILKSEKIIIK